MRVQVDMSTKRDEFLMWAAEVKKMDVEVLDRYEEKDLFKDFMEDYNTGAGHRARCRASVYAQCVVARGAGAGGGQHVCLFFMGGGIMGC